MLLSKRKRKKNNENTHGGVGKKSVKAKQCPMAGGFRQDMTSSA